MIAPLQRRTVVFAGGGSGGHLYPALALARAMPSVEAVFCVPPDRGDPERVGGAFRCVPLPAPRLDRGGWHFPPRLLWAVARARRTLRRLRASAVVGLGGYACVPACLAGRSLGLPIYLMECNAVPGRATRLLSHLARGIGLGSEAARARLTRRPGSRVTGTPLRAQLRRAAGPADFGLDSDRPTLLVLGGSQGASGLNTRVLTALPACADLPFQVLFLAGPRDAGRVAAACRSLPLPARVLGYLDDVGRAYAAADLVVARSGASTVAECLALGLPAVYVPYPFHADRHQERNAEAAVRAGAAWLVREEELSASRFRALVTELLLEAPARERMAAAAERLGRPGAAADMAAHLLESLGDAVAENRWFVEVGE
ncbi:MAG: glycosyltransferase [Planctomycetota bacterium]